MTWTPSSMHLSRIYHRPILIKIAYVLYRLWRCFSTFLLLFREFTYLFTVLHFLVVEATIKKYEQQTGSDDTATAAAADRRHNDVSATGHGSSDVIQKTQEDSERYGDVCTGYGKRDHLVVFATRVFARLYT